MSAAEEPLSACELYNCVSKSDARPLSRPVDHLSDVLLWISDSIHSLTDGAQDGEDIFGRPVWRTHMLIRSRGRNGAIDEPSLVSKSRPVREAALHILETVSGETKGVEKPAGASMVVEISYDMYKSSLKTHIIDLHSQLGSSDGSTEPQIKKAPLEPC